MKHILAALALLFSFNAVAETTVSTKQYRLEKSMDGDPRILQFTPPGHPHMVCLTLDDGNGGGLTCFPKRAKKKEMVCTTTFTGMKCEEK
ncbi:hypothetical protein VPHD148_0220 [Vibrio phage D148]